jgi:transmembrane sensor
MQITKETIDRYHLGQCTPEEQYAVERWLASDEVEMSFPQHTDLEALENKGWKKLSSRYSLADQPVPSRAFKLSHYSKIWQLVACVVLVAGAVCGYYLNLGWGNSIRPQMLVYKEVKTLKGQKLAVTLSDGTMVWLNATSKLRFPLVFAGKQRSLEFSGEAYFKVAKDPSKPFVIHTAKTKVQVLGTRFNLRALATETATSVVVQEGKVKFTADAGQQQLILTANKRGVYDTTVPSVPTMNTETVYAGKYMAWKNNELVLDNLTVADAALVLERWYNVEIRVDREGLRKERYTGSFSNPSLKKVLESMGFAVKFKYKQHGQTFILY